MAVEAILLLGLRSIARRGIAPADLFAILLSGVPLLLAVRLALRGSAPIWIAACLLAALVSHLTDLWRRWPRQ